MDLFSISIILFVSFLVIIFIIGILVSTGSGEESIVSQRLNLGQHCGKTSDCATGLMCEHICIIPPGGSCSDHPHGCGHNMLCSSHHTCIPIHPATSNSIIIEKDNDITQPKLMSNEIDPLEVTLKILSDESMASTYVIPASIISNILDATIVNSTLFYCDGSSKIYVLDLINLNSISSPIVYDIKNSLSHLLKVENNITFDPTQNEDEPNDISTQFFIDSITSFYGYVYIAVKGYLFRFLLSNINHQQSETAEDVTTNNTTLNLNIEIVSNIGKGVSNITYAIAAPDQSDPAKSRMYIMYQPDNITSSTKVISIDGNGNLNYLPSLGPHFNYRVYSWNNQVYANIYTADSHHHVTVSLHQSGKKKLNIPLSYDQINLSPNIDMSSESVIFDPYYVKPVTYQNQQAYLYFSCH
jgi:hypothetical protein